MYDDVRAGASLPEGIESLDGDDDEGFVDERNWLQKLNATEPLVIRGVVGSLIVLLIAFGVPISPDQKAAVLGAVGALVVMSAALSGRAVVWPEDSVSEIAGEMYVAGVEDAEVAIAEAQDSGGPI